MDVYSNRVLICQWQLVWNLRPYCDFDIGIHPFVQTQDQVQRLTHIEDYSLADERSKHSCDSNAYAFVVMGCCDNI